MFKKTTFYAVALFLSPPYGKFALENGFKTGVRVFPYRKCRHQILLLYPLFWWDGIWGEGGNNCYPSISQFIVLFRANSAEFWLISRQLWRLLFFKYRAQTAMGKLRITRISGFAHIIYLTLAILRRKRDRGKGPTWACPVNLYNNTKILK